MLDAATIAAGPLVATWLGEFGAEVVEVEQCEGVGLMWKSLDRNKKSVTSNLRRETGREQLRDQLGLPGQSAERTPL